MYTDREILKEMFIKNICENTGSIEFQLKEIDTLLGLLLEDNDYTNARKYAERRLEFTKGIAYQEYTSWDNLMGIAYYMSDGTWLLANLARAIDAAGKACENEPNANVRAEISMKIDMWKEWLVRLRKDINDPEVLD